jgi:hypothetical protein
MKQIVLSFAAMTASALSFASGSNHTNKLTMDNQELELDGQPELADGLYAQMNTNKGTILLQLHYPWNPILRWLEISPGDRQFHDPRR